MTTTDDERSAADGNGYFAMQPQAPRESPGDALRIARQRAADTEAAASSSPSHVQISTAAAITLGLAPGRLYRCTCTRCLNLLLTYPEGCRANCAYCGLARHREARVDYAERNFIRVDWPTVPVDWLIERIAADGAATPFQRMCISMITHPRSETDTLAILRAWTRRIPRATLPVSILSNPTTMTRGDVAAMEASGADIFTVALDAATPDIFERTRGKGVASPHSWRKYWEILDAAADIFGRNRFGAHLIVGMGESEHDMLALVQRLADMGGQSHMFCFYPERGSLMEHLPATPRGQWRRIQLARYLIAFRGARVEHMRFDGDGRLVAFGMPQADVDAVIAEGIAFRTSGCPGSERHDVSACDRPYGDSPPTDIASFPFQPADEDLAAVRSQLGCSRGGAS